MKKIILSVAIVFISLAASFAQNRQIETAKKPIVNSDEEMKTYVMVFLKTGPTRNQTKEKAAEIQTAHLEHLSKMAEEGFLLMAGPFTDESEVKGILVLNTQEIQEAKNRVEEDPAIKAGRLKAEYHLWFTKSGSITLP